MGKRLLQVLLGLQLNLNVHVLDHLTLIFEGLIRMCFFLEQKILRATSMGKYYV